MPKTKKRAAAKPKAKAQTPKSAAKTVPPANRLKNTSYRSFSLHRRIKPPRTLPGAIRLLGRSLLVLKKHWQLFLAITLVYGILNILLVGGLASNDLNQVKADLNGSSIGQGTKFGTGLTLFIYLLGSTGNTSSANAGVYQTLLIIIVSLVTIWSLRQIYNGVKIHVQDAFYRGVAPLVQFVLVLLVIGLQLLPLLLGALLYSTVINNSIAVYTIEKILWLVLFIALALVSLYMLTSSLFALYIVTLPDMTPLKALKSARELVRYRRWEVLRKVIFLPLALLVIATAIMLPLILLVTPSAKWVFFTLTMAGLLVIHSYMYALYRELLI